MTEKGADMFQQDNAFIVFLNKLADMVILSVLFCLCCLPVFTIGAAGAALYHTVVKVLRHNQGYAFATFRDSFKGNFRQSVPATLLFLLAYVMFGATCYFCYQQPDNLIAGVYVVFSMLSILLLIFAQLHYFALLGRFNLSKKERQTLTVRLTFRQLLSNFLLLCILIFAAELAVSYPPTLFIVPAAACYLNSLIQERLFPKYIRYQDEEELCQEAENPSEEENCPTTENLSGAKNCKEEETVTDETI